MQTQSISRYFGLHGAALELRSQRLEILASNVANAATPHFKARDMDFQAALARATATGPLAATAPGHFATAAPRPGGEIAFRVPVSPSLDGNTVELATEQMAFSENAARYQSTLSFLNGRINQLRSALRGE